jgi:hypothetical protein
LSHKCSMPPRTCMSSLLSTTLETRNSESMNNLHRRCALRPVAPPPPRTPLIDSMSSGASVGPVARYSWVLNLGCMLRLMEFDTFACLNKVWVIKWKFDNRTITTFPSTLREIVLSVKKYRTILNLRVLSYDIWLTY